jgi:mono/diheme cytochrome c family protein
MRIDPSTVFRTAARLGAALLFAVSLGFAGSVQEANAPEGARSGRDIYMTACAACHGAGGRGVSQSRTGFDLPLPDFTDCDFGNREPDDDWAAVAHSGGPTRGFSDLMPAFGEALSLDEIHSAIAYIRSLCTDSAWPRGDLNLPRPLVTEKAFPEDEAVIAFSVDENTQAIHGELVYEQRFGPRNQIEIKVPFGWNEGWRLGDPESGRDWASSLGDVAVGVKRAFYHNLRRGFIFSGTAEIILPTGDEIRGMGKGTFVFEPFVSLGQLLPSGFFLHSQAGLEIPTRSEKAETEAFARLVAGRTFTTGLWGRAWSPMIELLAGRELEAGQDINWDIVPQVQISLNKRQHILFNIGVRLPLNNTAGRDWQVMAYVLWDWFDGGFFEGW